MDVGGQHFRLCPMQSLIFLVWDMDKNIWEQVSAVLECRETGEPWHPRAALLVLISLHEGFESFILLFLHLQLLPEGIWEVFLKFCSLVILSPSPTKSHQQS